MDPVANLVAAYERLSERVRVALHTQLGNTRPFQDLQTDVRVFVNRARHV